MTKMSQNLTYMRRRSGLVVPTPSLGLSPLLRTYSGLVTGTNSGVTITRASLPTPTQNGDTIIMVAYGFFGKGVIVSGPSGSSQLASPNGSGSFGVFTKTCVGSSSDDCSFTISGGVFDQPAAAFVIAVQSKVIDAETTASGNTTDTINLSSSGLNLTPTTSSDVALCIAEGGQPITSGFFGGMTPGLGSPNYILALKSSIYAWATSVWVKQLSSNSAFNFGTATMSPTGSAAWTAAMMLLK